MCGSGGGLRPPVIVSPAGGAESETARGWGTAGGALVTRPRSVLRQLDDEDAAEVSRRRQVVGSGRVGIDVKRPRVTTGQVHRAVRVYGDTPTGVRLVVAESFCPHEVAGRSQ